MAKHGNPTGDRRFQERKQKVQTWLMQDDYQVSEQAHEGAAWIVVAVDGTGRSFGIIQENAKPERLLLQGEIIVSPEHVSAFARLTPKERQEMLWDMRLRLAEMNLYFGGLDDPLQRVAIQNYVHSDGMTRDNFLDRLKLLRNGLFVIVWCIQRKFSGEPPQGLIPFTVSSSGPVH